MGFFRVVVHIGAAAGGKQHAAQRGERCDKWFSGVCPRIHKKGQVKRGKLIKLFEASQRIDYPYKPQIITCLRRKRVCLCVYTHKLSSMKNASLLKSNAIKKDADAVALDYLFDQVAGYMALFAEPTRLRIMHALCDKECSVNEVVHAIGATQTNVSRQLSIMHKSRVLSRRKEGTAVYYTVCDPKAVALCRSVSVTILSRLDEENSTVLPQAAQVFVGAAA